MELWCNFNSGDGSGDVSSDYDGGISVVIVGDYGDRGSSGSFMIMVLLVMVVVMVELMLVVVIVVVMVGGGDVDGGCVCSDYGGVDIGGDSDGVCCCDGGGGNGVDSINSYIRFY